jgi:hypothetical protein
MYAIIGDDFKTQFLTFKRIFNWNLQSNRNSDVSVLGSYILRIYNYLMINRTLKCHYRNHKPDMSDIALAAIQIFHHLHAPKVYISEGHDSRYYLHFAKFFTTSQWTNFYNSYVSLHFKQNFVVLSDF